MRNYPLNLINKYSLTSLNQGFFKNKNKLKITH